MEWNHPTRSGQTHETELNLSENDSPPPTEYLLLLLPFFPAQLIFRLSHEIRVSFSLALSQPLLLLESRAPYPVATHLDSAVLPGLCGSYPLPLPVSLFSLLSSPGLRSAASDMFWKLTPLSASSHVSLLLSDLCSLLR